MTYNIVELGQEIEKEIEEDKLAKLPELEAKLHKITQHLLILERDWNAPGSKVTVTERVDRIIEFISKESF